MTDDDPRRGAPAERTREDGATPEPAAEPVVSSEPTPVVEEAAPAEPPIEPSIPILSQETKYRDEPAPPVVPPVVVPSRRASSGVHMREVVREKKRVRLEKVVALAIQKRVITNKDAEELLKVSDATAT